MKYYFGFDPISTACVCPSFFTGTFQFSTLQAFRQDGERETRFIESCAVLYCNTGIRLRVFRGTRNAQACRVVGGIHFKEGRHPFLFPLALVRGKCGFRFQDLGSGGCGFTVFEELDTGYLFLSLFSALARLT